MHDTTTLTKHASLIGLGHPTATDDAIGLFLVEQVQSLALRAGYDVRLWPQTDALTMAHDLLQIDREVIVVDAADWGGEPGKSKWFDSGEIRLRMRSDSVSTHGLGLADALDLARGLGYHHPFKVFGIQPFNLSPGLSLSAELTRKLPHLRRHLLECLGLADKPLPVPDARKDTPP